MKYFDELKKAMNLLAEQPNAIFLGQAVGCAGTGMSNTLADVPMEKRLELPVMEETQMGMSTGLALQGFLPISIYPRLNFLVLSLNQLVNHLDKYPLFSDFRPKVIIRSGIGSVRPLDPQPQHKGDYTEAIKAMLSTVKVFRLEEPEDIVPAYEEALAYDGSSLIVEVSDFLYEK